MICFRVDAFNGRKKVDSEVVTKSKLNKTMNAFEDAGYTVRKKRVEC